MDIIKRIAKGENKALEELFLLYKEKVFRMALAILGDRFLSEDVVQETFLKFYYSEKHFSTEQHLKAWLIVTASNYCKDLLKQAFRKQKNLEDFREIAGEEEQHTDEIMEIVMNLPEKYKTSVYLYYYEGYNSREIAKLLHKPESTIRTYLQKARKILKQEIGEKKE